MLLSFFLSFHLARKVSSRDYVQLVTSLIIVVSLVSMVLPLSLPFYALLEVTEILELRFYVLYFLTFEIRESVVWISFDSILIFIQNYFFMFFLHYLFFLLVNVVGAVLGYWISKSAILERLFRIKITS